MWQCQKCETLNDDERCIICAEAKPIINPADIEKEKNERNTSEQYDEKANYNSDQDGDYEWWQKVLITVFVIVILIIICASLEAA